MQEAILTGGFLHWNIKQPKLSEERMSLLSGLPVCRIAPFTVCICQFTEWISLLAFRAECLQYRVPTPRIRSKSIIKDQIRNLKNYTVKEKAEDKCVSKKIQYPPSLYYLTVKRNATNSLVIQLPLKCFS
jgi:hypothetical protein